MEDTSIAELQQKMAGGALSARDLVSHYFARIDELDNRLNAVLERNPDALSIADALDEERSAKGPRGPLHGIPVLIKDNIDTADRMTTTAGSLALQGSVALQDAFVVKNLREAGAVILGKTNLSEWANIRSPRSSSGWSSRGGQTRNPYALDRTPGGSSSGSGVAVAADFCAAAIGTETDGSITGPAAMNSLVGIKPTVGLVSRSGIIPISHSQDTAGPMARSVSDAALLLGALTGVDARDAKTRESAGQCHADYTVFLDPQGLRGARIGIARDCWPWDYKIDRVLDDAIAAMREHGATLVDGVELPDSNELWRAEREIFRYELKAGLNAYFASLGDGAPVRTLRDVIEFNERNRDSTMPYFEQEFFHSAQTAGPLADDIYRLALASAQRLARDKGIGAALQKNRLDAIAAPTTSAPWLIDLVNGDNRTGSCSRPPAVAGYPHISVPAGYVLGLPVGLSFFAGAYQESVLIRLAYAFEQATKTRRPPRLLPTAQV